MAETLNSLIGRFLEKAFDIRDGERTRALLMQLNIFCVITTLLIVKPTVNGLFLSTIGVEQLPKAFLLVAGCAILLSTVYSRLLARWPLNRMVIGTLLLSVVLFVVFGILLRFEIVGGWILWAFYIWVAIFGVLTASQFWILANVVFNVREAKRLFGFIGAGAIAGGIFGGYLTTLLVEHLGSENLPFLGASFLFLCVPITAYIWKKDVSSIQTRFQRRKKIPRTEHPIPLIRKSPHLTYLAGIIAVGVIVAKLVDYQFNAIASERITDPDELTSFFGLWFSNFNVIALTVQLLLTRRVVGTLGVGTSLYFLPLGILAGAVLVFFVPELWAAILIKMSDGSLKQSVNKAAVELLALPIPNEIKSQTKTFIDVVVDSFATGLGGLILIFLVDGLDLSTKYISIMIAGLIGVWIYFVIRVRNSYLQSFKQNVTLAMSGQEEPLDLSDTSVLGNIIEVLEQGTDQQVLYMLRKINLRPDKRLAQPLRKLLKHSSDEVIALAIRNLYFIKGYDFYDDIEPLTHSPAQIVKIAAFDYLITRSEADALVMMEKYLRDPDHKVRAAALVSLAEESRDNPALWDKFALQERLQSAHEELNTIADPARRDFHKIGLLKAMGLSRMPRFFPFIEASFDDPNQKVAGQALLSAGNTMHPYFIPQLLEHLAETQHIENARKALVQYGPEIIRELRRYVGSRKPRLTVVRAIPAVLANFGVQSSADLLFELLQSRDSRVRLSALRSLNHLKINHGYLNFHLKEVPQKILQEARLYHDTLSILYVQMKAGHEGAKDSRSTELKAARWELVHLLEKRLDSNVERIFRLLGLKYAPEDVISIYEGIRQKRQDVSANALEYLENLLEPGLRKILIPIVETALLDTISDEVIQQLNLRIPSERECYELLLARDDDELKRLVSAILKLLGQQAST